jgi:hypothetical protein
MTQVDRALAALTNRWLGPHELTEVSGRANPEGLRRDAKAAAYQRGLWWHEMRITPPDGRAYKSCMVTTEPLLAGLRAEVTSYPPASEAGRRAALAPHLSRSEDVLDRMRADADRAREAMEREKELELDLR